MHAILRSRATLVAILGLVAAGCGEDKKTTVNPEPSASATAGPQKPVLDGKLGAAVRAAESAQAANPSAAKDGPPETGVFGPGLADKAHPPGAPAKVELLGEGTEPKMMLALAPTDEEQRETVVVGVRQAGQAGTVNLEYALSIKTDKPKDKPKDDKAAAGPKTFQVVATVTGVGAVGAALPKDDADRLAKLKGTELRYQLGSDGTLDDIKITLAKDADAVFEGNIRALANALSLTNAPLPTKPVGVGGYWIVTDRSLSFIGADVVRYRVFKVESIDKEKNRATLSVEVRQYATRDDLELGTAGKGQKLGIERFDSQGKAKLDWSAAAFLPARGETAVRTQIVGHVQGGPPGQKGTLQTELAAKLAAVEGKADKKK